MNQIKNKPAFLLACGLALVALPCAFAEHTIEHSADAMFKATDTNSDGKLSRAEHATHAKKMFADTDTNHDRIVTLKEMSAAQVKLKADMTVKSGTAKPGDKAVMDAMDNMSPAAMIKMHDTNKDGQLSAAEQTAGCDAMFNMLDTDKDSTVSKDECKEGHKMMQSSH